MMYIKSFDKMLTRYTESSKSANQTWQNGQDVFRWWMGED